MMDAANNKRNGASGSKTVCTCGSLRKASRRISQFYDAALAPVGLKSTQYAILAEIEHRAAAGAVTVCELAAAMVMDRSTLGHNLRPLERDELLELRQSRDDRRKRYVALTKKGKALLQRAEHSWRRAQDRIEQIFGKQSAAELRAVLLKVAGNRELTARPPRHP